MSATSLNGQERALIHEFEIRPADDAVELFPIKEPDSGKVEVSEKGRHALQALLVRHPSLKENVTF
jgi:hypothetical protein